MLSHGSTLFNKILSFIYSILVLKIILYYDFNFDCGKQNISIR